MSNIDERNKSHVIMKAKTHLNNKEKFLQHLKQKKNLEVNEKRLMRAVILNNCEKVEELLSSNVVSPNIFDNLYRTPLHLAASRNYKDIITILLKYGADPNQRDIIGNTALHLAACSNNLEIVTMLLDAGTDVASLDKHGRNPLQLAESKLKLLQNRHREGFIELTQLRQQLMQIIELMYSFLRRQKAKTVDLEIINLEKLKINDSSDSQLENQMSIMLTAIQNISL